MSIGGPEQFALALSDTPSASAGSDKSSNDLLRSRQAVTSMASTFVAEATLKKVRHLLISCSKQKVSETARADVLYSSALFKGSKALANRLDVPFSILSAKHGLLRPECQVAPYDLSLKQMSKERRGEWARTVASDIAKANISQPAFFTGTTYSKELAPLLEAAGLTTSFPMRGLGLGRRLAFLSACHRLLDRQERVAQTYEDFRSIALKTGLYTLKEVLKTPLPSHGVYFFFDPNEISSFSKAVPRLVRVGTHGVSAGSKATLKGRLRTHFGTREGLGNHRSSVFRLHVGQALIERDGLQASFPAWGKSVLPEADESALEREVSRYMQDLLVLWIQVHDLPHKESARAFVERNVISLFTEDNTFLETSSSSWIGHFSNRPTIRESGLWNVRSVGDPCDLSPNSIIFGYESGFARRPELTQSTLQFVS